MAAYPGWNTTFPNDIILDSGALWVGANGSGSLLGRSRGGLTFDPGRQIEAISFDGMRAEIEGLHHITAYNTMIKGKMLSFGSNMLPVLEPGLQSASGSGIVSTVYSMQGASQLFPTSAYGTDIRLIYRRSDLSYVQARMHKWLCKKYTIVSKDKDAAEIEVEFHGLLDMSSVNPYTGAASTTDDAPYAIEYIYSGSTL